MDDVLTILTNELIIDELGRGYAGMSDQEAADDGHLLIRDAPASAQALLQYLTLERFRTGFLYGRLGLVAHVQPIDATGTLPTLPIGISDAQQVITQEHIAAAQSLLRYVGTDTVATVTLLDARFDAMLTDLAVSNGGCGAFGPLDKTAIQALSQNQQSRWTELGLGNIKAGNIAEARA